jgi:hypothetical protein
VTKEKGTPFAGLRLPSADRLKPGNAETRFAIIVRKRSSNIRIAVNRLEPVGCGSFRWERPTTNLTTKSIYVEKCHLKDNI